MGRKNKNRKTQNGPKTQENISEDKKGDEGDEETKVPVDSFLAPEVTSVEQLKDSLKGSGLTETKPEGEKKEEEKKE